MNKVITTTALASLLSVGVANANPDFENRIAALEKQLAEKNGSSSRAISSNWFNKTSIGGYGELHANFNKGGDNEIDFHRFVLFINHEFNSKVRFVSELELEHSLAGDGKPGEVELEQAYVEFDLANDQQFRAGLFLVPVGLLNETHEPPTFFGVERNSVEKNIIPTTWWEAGIGYTKKTDAGFNFDAAITSGLNLNNSGNLSVRSGRSKVAEAAADSVAFTGRVTYVGMPGLKVSAFGQYNTDVLQNDSGPDSDAFLYGATFEYENNGFAVRALYAGWEFDDQLPADAQSQSGWYIEPSYTFDVPKTNHKAGVFVRYEDMEYYKSSLQNETVTTTGVNYWPTENVVLKADYQWKEKNGTDSRVLNLGVGYQF